MKSKYTLKTATTALRANKTRSGLTILGIVIGITAIILVTGLGQGAENLILDQIRGLGSQTIIIEPGREPQGPSDFAEALSNSLGPKELAALLNKTNVPNLKRATPFVVLAGTAVYGQEAKRGQILGSSEQVADIFNIKLSVGRMLTLEDIKERGSVVVIGSQVKDKLFGLSDAVDQRIKIKNKSFKVMGVIEPKGNIANIDIDNLIVMPYTTVQQYLLGINYFHTIMAQADSEAVVAQVSADIKTTLRQLHNITDPTKDDFHLTTQADAIERVGMVTTILSVLLGSIAAISLVVGGVGIMNIMLVSVTERTREIGLRKAVGASNKDIVSQFLTEAVLLTLLGGFVGIAFGAGFSLLASIILSKTVAAGWSFTFPWKPALIGIGISALVGLIFGLYPARQAAKKSPIEALRYE